MTETTKMIKAIANDSKVRIDRIVANYEQLEKENAELKEKLKEELKTIADKDLSFVARFDALEKENAELKEKVNILDNCNRLGDVITEAYKDQLTKAKELLKQWLVHSKRYLWIADDCNKKIMQKEIAEAEQFLNSEVEK